jgi:preprotein translocase subunit SecG
MKTDKSTNLMLVVFCAVLIGFVFLSSKMSDTMRARQAALDAKTEAVTGR